MDDNISEIKDLISQAIDEAKRLNFDTIYILGDVFDSRKSQSLKVLEGWMEVLNLGHKKGIVFRCIPGNHDKPSYKEERSYLDLYAGHPSFQLTRDFEVYMYDDYVIHMIPFFDEGGVYFKYLNKSFEVIEDMFDKNHILLTHIAVSGVKNNDGSVIDNDLTYKSFRVFERVFIGHYHNYQEFDNIVYFGSIKQKDFGEDNKKGFTIVYTDGSWEQIRPLYKEYKVVKIDLDKSTQTEIDTFFDKHQNSFDHVRFKFIGNKEQIKSINKTKYEEVGIDVKYEQKDPTVNLDYTELQEFKGFDKKAIKKEWKSFSQINDIEQEVQEKGRDLLIEIFK